MGRVGYHSCCSRHCLGGCLWPGQKHTLAAQGAPRRRGVEVRACRRGRSPALAYLHVLLPRWKDLDPITRLKGRHQGSHAPYLLRLTV